MKNISMFIVQILCMNTVFAQQVPQFQAPVAVIGDSYTRAMWADTEIGKWQPTSILDYIRVLTTPAGRSRFSPEPDESATSSSGVDDLTYADFKELEFLARDNTSFILSDKEEWSLLRRMRKLHFQNPIYNFAQIGGTYTNAFDQALHLRKAFASPAGYLRKPKAVFINLNGLDFLIDRDDRELEGHIRDFLSALFHNQSWDVFMTMPMDSGSLFTHGDPVTIKPLIGQEWSERVNELIRLGGHLHPSFDAVTRILRKGLKCSQVFDILKIGPNGGRSNNIARHNKRIAKFRILIKSQVSLYRAGFGGYKGDIKLANIRLPDHPEPYLAVDCLHLNSRGQKHMADQVWPQFERFLQTRQ